MFDAGDIVWIEFGAPLGHRQGGRRPALVVSPRPYNDSSAVILVCPITRSRTAWPFKVPIQNPGRIRGAIVVDQIRSIDGLARFARRAESVSPETLGRV